MSLVLGLSVTTRDIRGELVDGATGEGDHLDRAVLDAAGIQDYLATLPADEELAAVGLTWTPDAESDAIKVREALDVYGGGSTRGGHPGSRSHRSPRPRHRRDDGGA